MGDDDTERNSRAPPETERRRHRFGIGYQRVNDLHPAHANERPADRPPTAARHPLEVSPNAPDPTVSGVLVGHLPVCPRVFGLLRGRLTDRLWSAHRMVPLLGVSRLASP